MQIELASLRISQGCGQIVMTSDSARELAHEIASLTHLSQVRDEKLTGAGLNFLQRLP
jgi:hypothetical protein